MPTEQGGDEVAKAEDVETSREDGARNAVEDGEVPGYLRLVDGEVRGDGAGEALFYKAFVGGGGVGRRGVGDSGCDGSALSGSGSVLHRSLYRSVRLWG